RDKRVRRANAARRTAILGTYIRNRVSRFLQERCCVSKNASRTYCVFEWSEIERRDRAARSTRPHCAPSALPGLSHLDRTARSDGIGEIRASDVLAAIGFLGCKPGSVLGTCWQVRPASRSV